MTTAYKGTNYLMQDAAAQIMWERLQATAPYPIQIVPAHPGPRPPRWRWRARKRWQRVMFERNQAKAWNFLALYGAKRPALDEVVIYDDCFPWTRDAWDQMFPPGRSA